MKKILIISPHFPPSNLAAVHRSRLFAQHLPSFGWEPVILTIHEDFYEEKLDRNLERILPEKLRIEKVAAMGLTKPRLIGDMGLRGFRQMAKKAVELVKNEKFDFLYIPIPSFYAALIGRIVHAKTGIPYGIDYIDPWVHHFPGSDKMFSRHWLSTKLAKTLEPIAIKNASLITGVAEGYYKGVQDRNPHLLGKAVFGAMPYGGEKSDVEQVKKLGLAPYLFQKDTSKLQIIYAGAFLPKAYPVLEQIFQTIAENKEEFKDVVFHFVGTGRVANDAESYSIKPLAEKYGLYGTIVKEYAARIPYLDVLIHLEAVDGVFVLGSTEPHYTPSKVYQGVLSGKPLLAVLHSESSACNVIRESNCGVLLAFKGEEELVKVRRDFLATFTEYRKAIKTFDASKINLKAFDEYSAASVTQKLAELLDKSISIGR